MPKRALRNLKNLGAYASGVTKRNRLSVAYQAKKLKENVAPVRNYLPRLSQCIAHHPGLPASRDSHDANTKPTFVQCRPFAASCINFR
jgi:hypothetical protein